MPGKRTLDDLYMSGESMDSNSGRSEEENKIVKVPKKKLRPSVGLGNVSDK